MEEPYSISHPMIQVEGLSKSYGTHQVLKQVNFELGKGEIYGLLGPNGSGKTTFIQVLAGMISPQSGTVTLNGHSYADKRIQIYQDLGVFLDENAFFTELTIQEQMLLEAGIRKVDSRVEACERFLHFFDLWEKRNELTVHGSKGMKKKLGLSLALIHKPKVVLLDEPFEGLDPIASRKLIKFLQHLKNENVSIVLTSHTLHLLPELLDRVGFMKDGQILEEDIVGWTRSQMAKKYIEYFQSEESKRVTIP